MQKYNIFVCNSFSKDTLRLPTPHAKSRLPPRGFHRCLKSDSPIIYAKTLHFCLQPACEKWVTAVDPSDVPGFGMMTGMARILKTIGQWIPAISLLLCVGLSLLWMRSQYVSDSLIFPKRQADGTEYNRLASSYGGIVEWGTQQDYQTWNWGSHATMFGPEHRWGWSRSPWSSAFNLNLRPKFHFYSATVSVTVFDRDSNSSTRTVKAYFLRMPYWALTGAGRTSGSAAGAEAHRLLATPTPTKSRPVRSMRLRPARRTSHLSRVWRTGRFAESDIRSIRSKPHAIAGAEGMFKSFP